MGVVYMALPEGLNAGSHWWDLRWNWIIQDSAVWALYGAFFHRQADFKGREGKLYWISQIMYGCSIQHCGSALGGDAGASAQPHSHFHAGPGIPWDLQHFQTPAATGSKALQMLRALRCNWWQPISYRLLFFHLNLDRKHEITRGTNGKAIGTGSAEELPSTSWLPVGRWKAAVLLQKRLTLFEDLFSAQAECGGWGTAPPAAAPSGNTCGLAACRFGCPHPAIRVIPAKELRLPQAALQVVAPLVVSLPGWCSAEKSPHAGAGINPCGGGWTYLKVKTSRWTHSLFKRSQF